MIQTAEIPKCRAPIAAPMERPSENDSMCRLKSTVGLSLKQALEKQVSHLSLNDKATGSLGIDRFVTELSKFPRFLAAVVVPKFLVAVVVPSNGQCVL